MFLALMGIIFAIPRLILVVVWVFYRFWLAPVQEWYWLLIGFIFLPYSLLWYCAIYNWYGGTWGWWQIGVMIVAIIADLTSNTKQALSLFEKAEE